MSKKYARIKTYGTVLVPLSHLEKFTENCLIAETEWGEDGEQLSKIKEFSDFSLIDRKDIDVCISQQELEDG